MNKIKLGVSFVAAALGVSTTALGGTLDAFTFSPASPVAAFSTAVTYSMPADTKTPALKTYAGFSVGNLSTGILATNSSPNTLNKVSLRFEAWVTDTDEKLVFHEVPSDCTKTESGHRAVLTCELGQLKSGDTISAFTVFFVAPEKVTNNGQADGTGEDKISTQVTLTYAEGQNGGDPSPPNSTQPSAVQTLVTLGTTNPTFVKSAMPKSGTTLFTGSGAIPSATASYPFAAQVVVPPVKQVFVKPATVELDPTPTFPSGACTSSGQLANCRQAEITIDEFSPTSVSPDATKPFLMITLRFAASEVVGKPVRPESIVVRYSADGGTSFLVSNVNENLCTGFGTENAIPKDDQPETWPCVANRVYYKNKQVPGYTEELAGVVELKFLVKKNGSWFSF